MSLDLDRTLTTIKNRQWVLGDIDWDAPGAELVPAEQRAKLKDFMADLMWIEFIGARGFAAMAKKAPTETLREIYRYFHAEEVRHANAELALMKRWDMLDGDEIPQPNVHIRYIMALPPTFEDNVDFAQMATAIPMLETALDGALLKFLVEEIKDPVCHQVFAKVNNDESRHLAVGFHVMGLLGAGAVRRSALEVFKILVSLRLISLRTIVAAFPLIPRMRLNLEKMGMDSDRILHAMDRYLDAGDRDPDVEKGREYRLTRRYASWLMGKNPVLYRASDIAIQLANRIPERQYPPLPSWSSQLTHTPVA